jgi:hypothetical protein
MGNFLAILNTESLRDEGGRLFRSGIAIARTLKRQQPSKTVETSWSHAASFPRQNGSGAPIFIDSQTGNWMLTTGTWFHVNGTSCRDEARLLRRYVEVGPAQLGLELEGFFTVVLGNARTREIEVITDVVGSCQCFIRRLPGGIALSGSSLLLAALQPYTLDPVSCQEFVHTGIIYEDRTIYKEVQKLGPASVFRFADGALKNQLRYWNPSTLDPESLGGEMAVRQLWDCLTRAAEKLTRRFPHPVCDLTGGYDSRAMVAAFVADGTTIATTVSGLDGSPDVVVSRGLAELANLPHQQFPPQQPRSLADIKDAAVLTDGEYDLVEYARTLTVHKALLKKFDISINGSFGEVARGYWWEILVPQTGKRMKLDPARLARLRYAPRTFTASLFKPELRLELVPHFAQIVERSNSGLSSTPNTFQMDHAYLAMRMQRWQGRIASSTNQLWPCLSPFMFRSVLETMLQTKASLRKRSLLIRRMLARFQPRLANFPLEHGYPPVPATWKTVPRFLLPLANHYGTKVLQRAGVVTQHASSLPLRPVRMEMWQDEEVRQLLNPAAMKSASLFDDVGLANFLSQSRQETFSANKEWSRLLTLEYTLCRIAGC